MHAHKHMHTCPGTLTALLFSLAARLSVWARVCPCWAVEPRCGSTASLPRARKLAGLLPDCLPLLSSLLSVSAVCFCCRLCSLSVQACIKQLPSLGSLPGLAASLARAGKLAGLLLDCLSVVAVVSAVCRCCCLRNLSEQARINRIRLAGCSECQRPACLPVCLPACFVVVAVVVVVVGWPACRWLLAAKPASASAA